MIRYGFSRGAAYFAIPVDRNLPKRVMLCIGRDGHDVTFSRLGGEFHSMRPDVIEGREVCFVQDVDGRYTVSAASVADIEVAANVLQANG